LKIGRWGHVKSSFWPGLKWVNLFYLFIFFWYMTWQIRIGKRFKN